MEITVISAWVRENVPVITTDEAKSEKLTSPEAHHSEDLPLLRILETRFGKEKR